MYKRITRGSSVFPAYAGMFLSRSVPGSANCGFPRVCGDVPFFTLTEKEQGVFSPRMRGCSGIQSYRITGEIVFPAYAGMFLVLVMKNIWVLRFPRVCGDVPPLITISVKIATFSPRMRGCSAHGTGYMPKYTVFPAYAGMFRNNSTQHG